MIMQLRTDEMDRGWMYTRSQWEQRDIHKCLLEIDFHARRACLILCRDFVTAQ